MSDDSSRLGFPEKESGLRKFSAAVRVPATARVSTTTGAPSSGQAGVQARQGLGSRDGVVDWFSRMGTWD